MHQPTCPNCSSGGVPVVWGKPTGETLRAHDLGLIRAGGCIVRGSPGSTWWCESCGTSFDGPDTAVAVQEAREQIARRPGN